jgi:excisionase family DNA binding protein
MNYTRDNKWGLDIPVMLTVDEIHEAFKLSRQFIYQLAKSGRVKAVKCGNKILINAQSVCDYLNSSTIEPEKPVAVGGIRPLV